MKQLFIVDASGYLYRSYHATGGVMTNAKGESTNALYVFIRSYLKLCKDFKPDHLVVVFDGPRNAKKRKEIYPEYKANRLDMPGDLLHQIEWAKQFCELSGIPMLCVPEVEADDTMGTVAKWACSHGVSTLICTSDKDMCQLVDDYCHILNTYKENLIIGPKEVKEMFGVAPEQMVDYLAITGDASDNVPGISGFGPKTAASLLQQFGTLDNLLANAAQVPGKKQEQLVAQSDKALLSRKLVLIDLSVPIPEQLEFYSLNPVDKAGLRDFYAGMRFNTLLKDLETQEQQPQQMSFNFDQPKTKYTLVNDEEGLNKLISALQNQNEIAFDTMTSDTSPQQSKLVGLSFCWEAGTAWYVPLNGKLGSTVLERFKPLFEDSAKKWVGHDAKFDAHVLQHHGIALATIGFDTSLASYVLNAHHRQHALDALALDHFGKVTIPLNTLVGKGKKALSMLDVPLLQIADFACEQADYTWRLKELFAPKLQETGLASVYFDIELPLLGVLAKMEREGIYLDIPFTQGLSLEIGQQLQTVEQAIYEAAGETFNINSPKELERILFDKLQIKSPKKTATGRRSTDADVLDSLQANYPIARLLLDYRTLDKLRSTYVDVLPNEVNPSTHRIHCTFNQSVASTGRLSSQEPNLQNIPIRSEFGSRVREAFKPAKADWSFLGADYSQIELRLLAHFSGDPLLSEAFRNNEDIHRYTASRVLNVPLEDVTSEQRHQAKAVNFGVVYGQQAFGLAQELGIDYKEAAAFIHTYFERYSKVKEYLEKSKEDARQTGKSFTLFGRQRLIPEIHNRNPIIRAAAERLAVNTPLQGTAADLIKLAMLKIDQALQESGLQSKMILQIHDELIFEAPDSELESLSALVKQTMENVVAFDVPIVVNISIGKNWKEC